MGKITVKHYLNTNLKPYYLGDEKLYKLYFLLRYNNKNTKIKSLLNVEMTEAEYSKGISENENNLNTRIANEISFVEKVIEIAEKTNIPFDMKLFNDVWQISTYPIIEKFEAFIKWTVYRWSLPKLNIYEEANIETYYEVLNSLKIFVSNSNFSISDELYLLQFFDKRVINAYKKSISSKAKTRILFKAETNTTGNIINTKYVEYKSDDVCIINNTLFEAKPFMFQSPNIGRTGNIEMDKDYFSILLRLITG